MQSNLLSHVLAVEFPELAETIAALKNGNPHFAQLLSAHDELDLQITKDEEGLEVMGDDALHLLKQRRAKLKDELYGLATAAQ